MTDTHDTHTMPPVPGRLPHPPPVVVDPGPTSGSVRPRGRNRRAAAEEAPGGSSGRVPAPPCVKAELGSDP